MARRRVHGLFLAMTLVVRLCLHDEHCLMQSSSSRACYNHPVYGWLYGILLKDFSYYTMSNMLAGANDKLYSPSDPEMMILTYNYKRDTKPVIIDARTNMWLDIIIDGHLPILNTPTAYATFVGLKVDSF